MRRTRYRNGVLGTAPTAAAAALALLSAGGCDDGGGMTEPESLSSFEKAVIEEIAVDHVMDLFWVADGSHGGTFPQLAYAYGLPGAEAGILASVTVDPSFEPGLYAPYCQPSILDGVRQCARSERHEDGDYDFQVYYTLPPDSTPRASPELTYTGETPVATVRYEPQPLRVWAHRVTPDGSVVSGVSVQIDEAFTVTSDDGASIELDVDGTMTADLEGSEAVEVDLSVAGSPACADLRIAFDGVARDDAVGDIRCGERVLADLVFTPHEPLDVAWRE